MCSDGSANRPRSVSSLGTLGISLDHAAPRVGGGCGAGDRIWAAAAAVQATPYATAAHTLGITRQAPATTRIPDTGQSPARINTSPSDTRPSAVTAAATPSSGPDQASTTARISSTVQTRLPATAT